MNILEVIKKILPDRQLIAYSKLFNQTYYQQQIDAKQQEKINHYLKHYLLTGEKKGINQNKLFDLSFYSLANPEHLDREKSPLLDYIKYGKKLGALTCPVINLPPTPTLPLWKKLKRKKTTHIKIAFFSHNLNLEGASIVCKDIAIAMKAKGNTEIVVFSPEDGILRSAYEEAGITIEIHQKMRDSSIISQSQFESFLKTLHKHYKMDAYDAIYANTMLSFWAINLSYCLNIPSIFHIHESEPINYHTFSQQFDFTPFALHALEKASHVVFVSKNTKDKYEPYHRSNNFSVIYNAFGIENIPKIGISKQNIMSHLNILEHERIYINVGTVTNRKGQIDLINSLKNIEEKILLASHFILIGDVDSPYSQYLHHQVKKLPKKIQSRVHFIKKTPYVFDYYRIADAFIFTSRIESYPKVIQEAMYFKLAIISTAVDGIPEQLSDRETALFYPAGDYNLLASLITEIHYDHHLRKTLAENAYTSLQKMITEKEMMDCYYQLFSRVIKMYLTK